MQLQFTVKFLNHESITTPLSICSASQNGCGLCELVFFLLFFFTLNLFYSMVFYSLVPPYCLKIIHLAFIP